MSLFSSSNRLIDKKHINIIISGHSSETDETFVLPNFVKVYYLANEGETCFVPYDEKSIVIGYKEIVTQYGLGKEPDYYDTNNYNILFDESKDGIFELNANDRLEKLELEIPTTNYDTQYSCYLSDIAHGLKNKYPDNRINIYCIFCRGSKRENFGNFAKNQHFNDLNPNNFNFDNFFNNNSNKEPSSKRTRTAGKRNNTKNRKNSKSRKTNSRKGRKSRK